MRRLLAALFLSTLLPLIGMAQWSDYELDTTLWGGGLPYGLTEGFNLPSETNISEPSFILTFIPTDTAVVADDGKWLTFDGFWMMTTEVTRYLWKTVMGNNAFAEDDKFPVNNVSPAEVNLFVQRLDSMMGMQFRLPTLEEWVFAMQGGHRSEDYRFSGSNNANFVAWWKQNAKGPHTVAQRLPNEAELYDMTGNVAEMVVMPNGEIRALGGHYASDETELTDKQKGISADKADPRIGFRLVCTTQRTMNSIR